MATSSINWVEVPHVNQGSTVSFDIGLLQRLRTDEMSQECNAMLESIRALESQFQAFVSKLKLAKIAALRIEREEAVQEVKAAQRALYDHGVRESGVLNRKNNAAAELSRAKSILSGLRYNEPNLSAMSDADIKRREREMREAVAQHNKCVDAVSESHLFGAAWTGEGTELRIAYSHACREEERIRVQLETLTGKRKPGSFSDPQTGLVAG